MTVQNDKDKLQPSEGRRTASDNQGEGGERDGVINDTFVFIGAGLSRFTSEWEIIGTLKTRTVYLMLAECRSNFLPNNVVTDEIPNLNIPFLSPSNEARRASCRLQVEVARAVIILGLL